MAATGFISALAPVFEKAMLLCRLIIDTTDNIKDTISPKICPATAIRAREIISNDDISSANILNIIYTLITLAICSTS